MTTKIEKFLRNFSLPCVTDVELAGQLKLSDNQRYGQVKRALQKEELVSVRKGLYCLGDVFKHDLINVFELAQKIYWPSYISLESALSYHGLIPEAVHEVTSVTPRRAAEFQTPYGIFSFAKLPEQKFFLQVTRLEEGNSKYLIAMPWKAICDYVYCRKKNWIDLEPLEESLRIDLDELPKITKEEFDELKAYYNCNRLNNFIEGVRENYEFDNNSAEINGI